MYHTQSISHYFLVGINLVNIGLVYIDKISNMGSSVIMQVSLNQIRYNAIDELGNSIWTM